MVTHPPFRCKASSVIKQLFTDDAEMVGSFILPGLPFIEMTSCPMESIPAGIFFVEMKL